MKKTCLTTLAFLGAVLVVSAPLEASHYKMADGTKDFYYGRISFMEIKTDGSAPLVLRGGEREPITAILNMPIAPGDVITTPDDARCEIQFDTGTVLRLDGATELTIETVLAPSLSSISQISNIVLSAGRIYIMYKEYSTREVFQILTPLAALRMRNHTVAFIEAAPGAPTVIRVDNGRLQVMSGPDASATSRRSVRKSEILAVRPDHKVEALASLTGTDFDKWNEDVNRSFVELHGGLTPLPKPIRRLSPAVHYFAQTYGDRYGEWIWHDMVGYVWRPHFNDSYPGGSWRPYVYGTWQLVGDQMFWVPGEPWGWAPYHLGIWHWDKKRGWLWIPGSAFAPAWATWDFFFGYFAWRPWGLWDWMDGMDGFAGSGEEPGPYYLGRIDKNMLKKPGSSTSYPIPRNLKSVYRNAGAALKKGDRDALESLRGVPSQLVFVHEKDLRAPAYHEKALRWNDMAALVKGLTPADLKAPADPHRAAMQHLRPSRPEEPADLPGSVPASLRRPYPAIAGPEGKPGPSRSPELRGEAAGKDVSKSFRFRDWNPDRPIAQRMGVTIQYSSRDNAVQIPELRLTSRIGITPGMHPGRLVAGPGSSSVAGVAYTSSGSSTGTPASVSASESGSSRAGEAAQNRTGSEGTKEIKKN